MMSILLLLVAAAVASDPCAEASACRRVDFISTTDREGQPTRLPEPGLQPWIIENNLMLHPGEAVIVRLVEQGDGYVLTAPRTSGEPTAGEIRFSLASGQRSSTLLVIENRLPEWLDYMAVMNVGNRGMKTSVCSLLPMKFNLERWPHGMTELALSNFKKAETHSCK